MTGEWVSVHIIAKAASTQSIHSPSSLFWPTNYFVKTTNKSLHFVNILYFCYLFLCTDFRGLPKHWILKLSAGLQEKRGIYELCFPPYNMYVLSAHTLVNLSKFFYPYPYGAWKYVSINYIFMSSL